MTIQLNFTGNKTYNPFSHFAPIMCNTWFYISPCLVCQWMSADKYLHQVSQAVTNQMGQAAQMTWWPRWVKLHVSQLFHKQSVGWCYLVIGPAGMLSHKCDLQRINHACLKIRLPHFSVIRCIFLYVFLCVFNVMADRFGFWASQILWKWFRILNKLPYIVIY